MSTIAHRMKFLSYKRRRRVDGKFSCMTYDPFAICEWYCCSLMFDESEQIWNNEKDCGLMFSSPDHWPGLLLDLNKWMLTRDFLFTQINEAWSERSTSWMSRNHPLVLFIDFLHSRVSIYFLQVVVMMMMVAREEEEE